MTRTRPEVILGIRGQGSRFMVVGTSATMSIATKSSTITIHSPVYALVFSLDSVIIFDILNENVIVETLCCLYNHIHARTYARMHIHTRTHACTYIYTHAHTPTLTYARTYTYTYTHACTHTHARMYAHTHTYTRMYIHIRIHTYTHTQTYIYIIDSLLTQ